MVKLDNIEKSFWWKIIFKWTNMTLPDWIKAWLVWINGVWKTTLFKILSWEDRDFTWNINFSTTHPLIWYMKQQIDFEFSNISIIDFIRQYIWIDLIENRVNELMSQLEEPNCLEEYGEQYELFEKLWWYELNSYAERVLNSLWLWKYGLDSNVDKLSWWEKRKLLLCATLIKGWDLLLLDEPTNDLDKTSVQWLITLLKQSIASCLIVSHDKDFLNNVVKRIYEVDNWEIIQYSWDYSFYEKQKQQEYDNQLSDYERQIEEEKRIKKTVNELKWKAKGIWTKGNTRDNDKWDWSSKVEKKLAQAAKNIQNRIDRMEKVDKPIVRKPINLRFLTSEMPVWSIRIENLVYSYGESKDFKLDVKILELNNKDRLLIYGDNWQGKTTLLKLITWDLQPNSGKISISPSFKIWYFSQEQIDFPSEMSAINYLSNILKFQLNDIHSVLWWMGFTEDDKNKNIDLLSPWMRLRLSFAIISLKKVNCLILDEPTNHVDIGIKTALKNAINLFDWMVIIVSHDSEFTNELSFTKRIYMEKGNIIEK